MHHLRQISQIQDQLWMLGFLMIGALVLSLIIGGLIPVIPGTIGAMLLMAVALVPVDGNDMEIE